jgi:hypothetical protein
VSTLLIIAGKRNIEARDKEAETASKVQGRRSRDKISLANPANSGLIAENREIDSNSRHAVLSNQSRTKAGQTDQQAFRRICRHVCRGDRGSAQMVQRLCAGGDQIFPQVET